MHPHLKPVVACMTMIMTCSAAEAGQSIVCPPQVTSDQIRVQGPAGWTGAYLPDIKLKLESAGARLGPLELEGALKGEVTRKGNTTEHRFSLTGGVSDQLDKWMVCTYGGNVYQARKLPTETKECTVTYRRSLDPKAKPSYALSTVTCS